jgi:hypothetical protein
MTNSKPLCSLRAFERRGTRADGVLAKGVSARHSNLGPLRRRHFRDQRSALRKIHRTCVVHLTDCKATAAIEE